MRAQHNSIVPWSLDFLQNPGIEAVRGEEKEKGKGEKR